MGPPGGATAMAAARHPDMGCTSPCAKVQKVFRRALIPSYLRGFGGFPAIIEFYLTF